MTKAHLIHALRDIPNDAPIWVEVTGGAVMILNVESHFHLSADAQDFHTAHIHLDSSSFREMC